MSYRDFKHERYCISCNKYKPPGGPPGKPWKCADCRKAIAERREKIKSPELSQ